MQECRCGVPDSGGIVVDIGNCCGYGVAMISRLL